MNNEQLLLCACAILAGLLFIQSCWIKSDAEAAELAVAQLERKNKLLKKELDKRDRLNVFDLTLGLAAQDAAQTEAAPLALVG